MYSQTLNFKTGIALGPMVTQHIEMLYINDLSEDIFELKMTKCSSFEKRCHAIALCLSDLDLLFLTT